MKFKKGDRVVHNGMYNRGLKDRVGIVISIMDFNGCDVDFAESGWDMGHTCRGKISKNTGWWCAFESLKLVKAKKEFLVFRRKE
jgi:hypothetical protein